MKETVPLLVLLLGTLCSIVVAQDKFQRNCDDAPAKAERDVCLALQKNARLSRGKFANESLSKGPPVLPVHLRPLPVIPGSRGQIAFHPYECMTVNCLCPFFKGRITPNGQCILENGMPLTMGFRKELRMLTEEERNRFHNAMAILKRSGEFDRMCIEHFNVGTGSGAHSGPGFLPWHREFLKRTEIALRLIDPTVSLPYWDTAMDSYLEDPRDSVLFSPLFLGDVDNFGGVVNGPYAYWSTMEGGHAIMRNLGNEGFLVSEAHIASVLDQSNIEYVLAYTAPLQGCPYPENSNALEFVHSFVHLWVGGHMREPPTSANDPIFYLFHSFVDMIWEMWRQARQDRGVRELDYPPELPQCADPQHFGYAPMSPFNLINRDGLSNMYTDQMYRYSARPGCSVKIPTCGSPYLFCDLRRIPHCVSKIKLGGICGGFDGLDACFNGVCQMGRCMPTPTPSPFVPRVKLSSNQLQQINQQQARRSFGVCFNLNPCCDNWAKNGDCTSNKAFMDNNCPASCHVCKPAYNTNNECNDRHVSCQQWRSEGQCHGKSHHFMQENCRASCRLCTTKKNAKCPALSPRRPQITRRTMPSPSSRRSFARRALRETDEASNKPTSDHFARYSRTEGTS